MNDYRISNKPYDTPVNKPEVAEVPAIGALAVETLDTQAETLSLLNKLALVMFGDEPETAPVKPADNMLSMLGAIRENQKSIVRAVQIIIAKL